MKYFAWILFCLTVAGAAPAADLLPSVSFRNFTDRTQIDSVLVSVNGDPITLLDVILETAGYERDISSMLTGERLLTETRRIRREALESLILRKLLSREYQKHPFPIPNQEVENFLDAAARDIGDGTRDNLDKKLNNLGSSIAELRKRAVEKIATDAILAHLCDRKVFVTPKEVYDEYKNHPEEWTTPARIELELLQILRSGSRFPEPEKLVESLKKPMKNANAEQFHALVKEHSDAPAAATGGSIGSMERVRLRPEFAAALKGISIGQIAGPVETPEAWYYLRIVSEENAIRIPFSRISGKIHERLFFQAMKKNRAEYTEKLRSEAIIRYYIPQ